LVIWGRPHAFRPPARLQGGERRYQPDRRGQAFRLARVRGTRRP